MKRKIRAVLLILFFLVTYIYVCNITLLPSNIIVFQGENVDFKTLYGIKVNPRSAVYSSYNAMQASSNLSEKISDNVGTVNLTLDLFGTIPIKQIDVSVLPRTTVVPLGNSVGLKLYTEGVLVVGMSEIKGIDNNNYKPYENSGIEEGDRIIEVNNVAIRNTNELIENVNKSNGNEVEIVFVRDKDEKTTNIKPTKTGNNEYKLGLWVRDAAAGVGTATFYEPSTGKFAALGHGITDIDTGKLVEISNGELTTSTIVGIKKGERGSPGEVRGTIEPSLKLGTISKNGMFGISGNVTNVENLDFSNSQEMEVALRNEIKEGKAYILCELENGKKEKYEIEIQKVYVSNNYDNKSMLIKVTDERLLQKTRWNNSRNEWFANNSKWQIYWICYTCISPKSHTRLCGFCRYDD